MNKLLTLIAVAAIALVGPDSFARGSFGGSRSSGSSFGGSRSSSSSFGGSRSGSTSRSAGSSSVSRSSGSSFGGSRASRNAPIVRNNSGSNGSSRYGGNTTIVNNHYGYGGGYGYGGYYGSPYYGGGFFHGFMWGQFFNRPTVIVYGGQQVVAGPTGAPMLDENGQPVIYESHPFLTFLAVLTWVIILFALGFITLNVYRRYNEQY